MGMTIENIQQGWQCPICKRVYSPATMMCIYCGEEGATKTNTIKALEQEPRWIPVSERLPKIADVYRVTRYYRDNAMNPQYLVDACCFDGSTTWYNDNRINHERAHADNVIAWQENPEPYKVEPQESE